MAPEGRWRGVTAQADREVPIVGSQDPRKILDTLLYLLVAHNGPGRGPWKNVRGGAHLQPSVGRYGTGPGSGPPASTGV